MITRLIIWLTAIISLTIVFRPLETWTLTFHVNREMSFLGGEYQTRELCEAGAERQLSWARRNYGDRVTWSCERTTMGKIMAPASEAGAGDLDTGTG